MLGGSHAKDLQIGIGIVLNQAFVSDFISGIRSVGPQYNGVLAEKCLSFRVRFCDLEQ